ncbi:pleckstrin homology domain-containing family M member 1 [Diachasmimorpha longicaudata]|uniref:pleckstrin homology domain-containing family M member 1 n=1 Tax=Diachasmimorpha longicaudata TaxID=58733 RepID=UPI0030B893AA
MNALLKTVTSMTNKRNVLVKESLRKQLNTVVMEMQGVEDVNDGKPVGNCEESMALCSVLEAIFLHGLKDSLLNRVTEALSGPDFDAMPQPSFWGPLLVFSHRQMIHHIQELKQITTEVGYCRAWIRIALNEGLLSSYFASIHRDSSPLKPYYDRAAFIRDFDHMEVARRLIESLDAIAFDLACNNSLLNFWSSTPLLMAAIWSPPMKSCPIFSAVDIAKTINSEITEADTLEDVETASSIGSIGSFTSSGVLNNATVSEDEALRIILSNGGRKEKRREKEGISPARSPNRNLGNYEGRSSEERVVEGCESVQDHQEGISKEDEGVAIRREGEEGGGKAEGTVSVGNSLIGKLGWSTSLEDVESSMTSSVMSDGSNASNAEAQKGAGEGATYDALIRSYHPGGYATSPDLRDFLGRYASNEGIEKKKPEEDAEITTDDFDTQIGKLPREKGLDTQNYSCLDCDQPVGMTFAKAHVCSFTGNYYCTNCMSTEEFLIPSRIIHNWDLKHYPVSKRAAEYLTDCSTLLNLKILNPRIYTIVESMAQLQALRIQLNLLRAYLFTCREPIIDSLQKKVAPRDYLYEHVHHYSVSDLLDVPSGTLAQQLQKVVEYARNHVLNCWLCSQKGFICEVCNNPKVIYPFDMQSTFRCSGCNAVFHADCLNSTKSCPKCERRRKRIDRLLRDGETTLPQNIMTSSPIHMN